MSRPQLAYLHGFASGPESQKALWLEEQLVSRRHHLWRPDLNIPSLAQLLDGGAGGDGRAACQ